LIAVAYYLIAKTHIKENIIVANIPISKRTVDATQPDSRDTFFWDDEVKGFGLKVTPAGGKIYVFQYRIARPGHAASTPARRYTIGKHGNLTPEQARSRAKELALLVATGIDPREQEADELSQKEAAKREAEEKNRLANELAFDRVAYLWLDHYSNEKGRRPSSLAQASLVIRNHLKPALGNTPMPHIGRTQLQPIIDAIPAKQKAMRRNVFAYASILFSWALTRGYIPTNPLMSMAKPDAPKARERVLTDTEVEIIWTASGALRMPWGHFYRLLLLTGQRKSEVAGLRWEELDRNEAIWTIPANRAKNDKAHIVPLSPPAIAELNELAAGTIWPKSGYVLTTNRRTSISGFSKAKRILDQLVAQAQNGEAISHWRVHDIRRTVATGLQRLGVRFEVTEAVLNHVSGAKGGVAGVYQRHDWKDEKRAALDAWAQRFGELVQGAQPGDNVVKLEVRA
jgi:integrase